MHSPNLRAPHYLRGVHDFTFVGGRLWLDFVNTDDARLGVRIDTIGSFDRYVDWLEAGRIVDAERAAALHRRAAEQPSGAAAALVEARRVRAALRALAERGRTDQGERAREVALEEINRLLSRSVGTRRVEALPDGGYARGFVPVGDAFGGLMIPVVESAVDTLVLGELVRIHRCADRRCPRVFFDVSRSRTRRWCDMRTCGNRAKAQRSRKRT
ncbi:MAG TPA: CGNR zinc finger domain-containing protein [Gemmatimonadaceae bacterium]|nr:CGNR zinc finger domain-containing protein [Gemmatimonadaceae bacterium]